MYLFTAHSEVFIVVGEEGNSGLDDLVAGGLPDQEDDGQADADEEEGGRQPLHELHSRLM